MKKELCKFMAYSKIFLIILSAFALFSCSSKEAIKFDLLPVKSGEKWGYVDNEGKFQINPQFDEAYFFSVDGVALVKNNTGKYGFIDVDGKFVINPNYIAATNFGEGLACVVMEDGRPMYIDTKGDAKIASVDADYCGVFVEGKSRIKKNDKWGFISTDGQIFINPSYDACHNFKNGFAAVMKKDSSNNTENWGYINNKGELVIPFQFKSAGDFSQDLALVSDGKNYGYINKEGKYIINPQFEEATGFENNFAIFKQGSMYGYINKEGKIIINPQFEQSFSFSKNGLAAAKNSDGKWGYIDKEGKYKINPQFDNALPFLGNLAFVSNGDKVGIINEDGKFICNPQFESIAKWEYKLNFYASTTDVISIFSGRYGIVETDYFDINGFVTEFLKGTSANSFKNFSDTVSAGTIKNLFTDSLLKVEDKTITYDEDVKLNKFITLSNQSFGFNDNVATKVPIYRTVQKYDYWYGGYYNAQELDHYNFIYDSNVKLSSVIFVFSLTEKTSKKVFDISKLLHDEIIKLIKGKDAKVENRVTQNTNSTGYYCIENNNMYFYVIYGKEYIDIISLFTEVERNNYKSFIPTLMDEIIKAAKNDSVSEADKNKKDKLNNGSGTNESNDVL